MGTRADFYLGRGTGAFWMGSIAWDGHPESIPAAVLEATDARSYRAAVLAELEGRDDATMPERGWPWPWPDSRTTDYAYAFDDGKVWASGAGQAWFDPLVPRPDGFDDTPLVAFPNMTAIQRVRWDEGSGLIVETQEAIAKAFAEHDDPSDDS